MKKLNNKGLSIVEFIVVFVILMVLIFGMMDTIVGFKDSNNTTTMNKELLEYKTTLTKIISDDLIKRKFKNIDDCDTTGTYKVECTFAFENGDETKFMVDVDGFEISYAGIKYPIPNNEFLEFNGTVTILDDDGFLIIDIPIYEINNKNINYGINIKHPINLY